MLIRVLKPKARKAILSASGPFYEAIIQAVMRLNSDLCTKAAASEAVRELLGPRTLSEALSDTTRIKIVPDYVQLRGEWRPLLESDPWKTLHYTVEQRARRKAFVEEFSQGDPGPGSAMDKALRNIAMLRAEHIEQGGEVHDFDEALLAWFSRPYSEPPPEPAPNS